MKQIIRLLSLIILITLLYSLFSDNPLPTHIVMIVSLSSFILSYIGKKLDEKQGEVNNSSSH
jgi:hypothetical protein